VAPVSRGAVGPLLVFEPGVAVLIDECDFAVNAGDRTSGFGCATRGRLRACQQ
jgi:hypothetical protein